MRILPSTSVQPGHRVVVRRTRWTVTDVRRYDGCELVTVTPVDQFRYSAHVEIVAAFRR